MTRNVSSTSKSIEDSGVDIVGVAAVDLFFKIDWIGSSCLFSDTALQCPTSVSKQRICMHKVKQHLRV